jgi:hypothetical protein
MNDYISEAALAFSGLATAKRSSSKLWLSPSNLLGGGSKILPRVHCKRAERSDDLCDERSTDRMEYSTRLKLW